MFAASSIVRRSAVCLAYVFLLCSLTGCASKRFVPRIVSESVVIRDAAKVPEARIITGPLTLERVQLTPQAAKVPAGSPRRWQRGAIGTTGIGEREWKGSLEETFGAFEEPASAVPQPEAIETKAAEPAPVTARLASMGDSGLFLAIVAIGCVLGAVVYRYRVY